MAGSNACIPLEIPCQQDEFLVMNGRSQILSTATSLLQRIY
ncbi:hypothetical protein [Ignatzschineria sp. LJL83]